MHGLDVKVAKIKIWQDSHLKLCHLEYILGLVHTLFVHTYQFIGQKVFFWILWFQPKVKLCLFTNSSSIHSKNLQKTSDPNYQHKLGKIRAINKSVNAVINVSLFFKFFMIFFSHGVLTSWHRLEILLCVCIFNFLWVPHFSYHYFFLFYLLYTLIIQQKVFLRPWFCNEKATKV
mgnify:CR=1 FL=1